MSKTRYHSRFLMLDNLARAFAKRRWSSWPYTHRGAERLDHLQTELYACCLPASIAAGETPGEAVRRWRIQASWWAIKRGRWSESWRLDVIAYHAHLVRGAAYSHRSNAPRLLEWHGSRWLEARRDRFSACGESRTRS